MATPQIDGPLSGVRVVEFAGIGPGPFAARLLGDIGADVVRIVRPNRRPTLADAPVDILDDGRPSVALDLKDGDDLERALSMVERAEICFEPYRPGVAERLGVGPDVCLERNPGLVYGRMNGWGHHGPYAQMAGHDINYIALTGALDAIGRRDGPPAVPLNLVGDYGGGGAMLAFGLLAALVDARQSGRGRVVEVAMVDGAAALMGAFFELEQRGTWTGRRGDNLLDSGAWFYDVYETADGSHLAVGAIEPEFCSELVRLTGMGGDALERQYDRSAWPELRNRLAAILRTRSRDEWCAVFDGTDACVSPVLSVAEAPTHPHNVARRTFVERHGMVRPAPVPRFNA